MTPPRVGTGRAVGRPGSALRAIASPSAAIGAMASLHCRTGEGSNRNTEKLKKSPREPIRASIG